MGQSLNIITAPLPPCTLTVCVCTRWREKLCEFVFEKVASVCVYIQSHVSGENCVCVEEFISVCHAPAAFPLGGVKLDSPEHKDRRGKGLNLRVGVCVSEQIERQCQECMKPCHGPVSCPAQEFKNTERRKQARRAGTLSVCGRGGGVLHNHILCRGKPMNIVGGERQRIRPVFTGRGTHPHIWMSC